MKQEQKSADLAAGKMRFWEPHAVFLVTLAVLALFTQRMVAYLTPVTGDEPFYLMTAISIIKDGDLNECNNYIQLDDAQLYPSFYSFDGVHAYAAFPSDWLGWRGSPFPLPPHATHLVPASRQCSSDYLTYPVNYDNPTGELYSKHGLGLSLLVLPAFALGGRLSVVFFLNILGALLAVNIYLLASRGHRQDVARRIDVGGVRLYRSADALLVFDFPGASRRIADRLCLQADQAYAEQPCPNPAGRAVRGRAAVVALQVCSRVRSPRSLLLLSG